MNLILLLIFAVVSIFATNESDISEAKLVFNVYRKDIHILSLEKLSSSVNYRDTELLINTTGVRSYIGQIDYNINANILIWRNIEPDNALYVLPINKSNPNLLGIKDKTLLLKLNKSSSLRVSMDWIHNLIYYNFNDKIIVFNLTNPKFGYIVINEIRNTILDVSLNPLDSMIFWSVLDNVLKSGKIMRALQDGSNQTILNDKDLKEPIALATDLVLRRLFWIDRLLFKFCSVDFNGRDLQTILKSRELFTLSYYLVIYGNDIFWSNYFHSSILKTNKFGLNGTQINYLVRAETDAEIESIRIIDSSLQPISINRCLYSNCSHLCLPVSDEEYRCVCPHLNFNTRNNSDICIESRHKIDKTKQIFTTTTATTTTQSIDITSSSTIKMTFTPNITEEFSESFTIVPTEYQNEFLDIESNVSKTNTSQIIICNNTTNSSQIKKTFYIKNYQTSSLLYIMLIISLILNFFSIFAFIFQIYRRKKRKLVEKTRIERNSYLNPYKTVQFEMINSEVYNLINSNPLISTSNSFLKDEFFKESELQAFET